MTTIPPGLIRAASMLTGSLGLASTMAYLASAAIVLFGIGVGVDDQTLRESFVRVALPLVLVPYVLLILHLYLRTQLGAAYLQAGRLEEAIDYTADKLESSLVRSRREALFHRLVHTRALLASNAYDEAASLAAAPLSGRSGTAAQRLDLFNVALEALLRQEDLVEARELFERHQHWISSSPGQPERRAHLRACTAELYQRAGDRDACNREIDEASWLAGDVPRLHLSRALAASRFGQTHDDWLAATELLEQSRPELDRQLPGRAAELDALSASLFARLDQPDQARLHLEAALADERADGRACRLRDEIAQKLDLSATPLDDQEHTP